ncbi:MAG: DUF4823 domain-containing protein [Opitutaceae bacterium]|nr:DUF4823 domain-containing protein [Opitutaceae bacterium]
MVKQHILSLLTICIALVGCQTTTVAPVAGAPKGKILRAEKVYVVTPRDGSYGATKYPGSGAAVAATLEGAFSRYATDVVNGPSVDSLADAVVAARQKGCSYVVSSRITQWEDRATEWSGRRDKIAFIVKVVRTEDQAEIATAEIAGKSSLMTFGGDRPQDMLKKPVDEFVVTLY